MKQRGQLLKPTKQWLRDHSTVPTECPHPRGSCFCIVDKFNHRRQGYCVGYSTRRNDLDVISLCIATWDEIADEVRLCTVLLHPAEAANIATFLTLAATDA